MALLKQSTAFTRMFKMIDSADHFSKKTGLTCTVNISKAGGAFAAAGGTVTEVANGWYKIALTTTDTNTVGDLSFYITATGADDTDFVDQVSAVSLDDIAAYIDTEVAAIKAKTDNLTFTVANQVDVNVVDWKGAAAPAMTGDAFARLGAPAGASIAADIAGVQSDTDNIQTRIPAALVSGRMDASVGAVASGAIAAASFAAGALDAVWSTATRLLTAGTNIVLAKGAGVTGFNDLDAAAVRSAVGLASANLDTQLGAIAGYVDTEIGTLQATATAIKARTDNLPTDPADASDIAAAFAAIPTAAANADALLDRAAGVETGWTPRQALRIMLSVLAGKASGLDTVTAHYRDMADSKDRIVATVDANGNRSAVTRDAT